ncbi:hypothetical protein N6H18_12155 [Reichenbachiella agarivorans]|uniref:Uncharacterized protein n=1 Tax=Reichenbachiella agarivorans TaxID=2979464 RepID=A0ABY6CNR8_9BACT|nr:hypothetical protein [Reichenbachiella agarivorans]UXP31103.1 hypothetical protein N6H18_12155 [Reichenbachiella agarivorans]
MRTSFDHRYQFERKILIGISVLALMRSSFSIYQLLIQEIDQENLIAQSLLFFLYFGSLIYLIWFEFSFIFGFFFAIIFTLLNTFLWFANGGLTGFVEQSIIVSIIVGAIITRGRLQLVLIGFALVIEVLTLLIWDYKYDWIESIVGEQGRSIVKFQIMMVLVTIGMIYVAFQYQQDHQILRGRKYELQQKMAEIRKENDNLFEQQKELNEINAVLEERINRRKFELCQNNNSIEKYIVLSRSQISPSLEEISKKISGSQFYGEYGQLLKKSGRNLIKSFIEIERLQKD